MTAAGRLRELRSSWSAARAPGDPAQLPGLFTTAIDALVVEVVQGRNTSGWSVVAVGGYGRGEMCLHSDIDVMLLGDVPGDAVRQVLYPLWDSGMKVGHSVRTVREAVTAATESIETLCSLLTIRLITGDQEVLDTLERQLASLLRRHRSVPEALAGEERALRGREPFFLQEIDLKAGRGGLRSIHRDDWMRARARLLDASEAGGALESERADLLAVRNALHATQGRRVDRLAIELRSTVADWLGEEPHVVCSRVYRAARSVDDHMLGRWPNGLTETHDPVARAGRLLVSAVRLRRGAPGDAATPLPFAVANLGRPRQIPDDPGMDTGRPWTAADRAALVELLSGGQDGWSAFRRLSGWTRQAIPEMARVESLPQSALFHSHPVDSHLWRTVDETVFLTGGGNEWCVAQADEMGSIDEMLLAAWLHDVGKGLEGDHATVGAGLAREILTRFGYRPGTVDLVSRGVELHLLLPTVATRQDLDDPEVIREVASRIDDRELLSLLAVLTVADARATGPSVWSDWTETLVRTLVGRVATELEGVGYRVADVEDVEPELAAHVAAMPRGYLHRFGESMARTHLALASPPPTETEVRLEAIGDAAIPTVVAVAKDRPGLLAVFAGVFALHGLNVLEARIATRSDGTVIDTFRVEDAFGASRSEPVAWDRVRADLEAVVIGSLELEARLEAKASSYAVPAVDTRVSFEVGDDLWRFTVRGPDRVGLLHDLARVLTEARVEIVMAKVTTRGQQVLDVFAVTPANVAAEVLAERLEIVVGTSPHV